MAVVDIKKKFLYNPVKPAFGRLTVRDTSLYKYKGVSVPCFNLGKKTVNQRK